MQGEQTAVQNDSAAALVDGSGIITREQLKDALEASNIIMAESQLEDLVKKMDVDGDGEISQAGGAVICAVISWPYRNSPYKREWGEEV
jgi:hypothetical protein